MRGHKPKPEPPTRVITKLGTIHNTALAADLFATMLRSVDIAEKRIAEAKRNDPDTKATTERD